MALEAIDTSLAGAPASTTSETSEEDAKHQVESSAKGKRSRSHRRLLDRPVTDEEYLALCLLMLGRSSGGSGRPSTPAFECSVCGKAFPSYQALGGHKASHRKPTANADYLHLSSTVAGTARRKEHQCTLCFRTFASGQALGGHKRSHYDGVTTVVSSLGMMGSSSRRGFDLNLPAPEMAFGRWAAGKEREEEEEEEELLYPLCLFVIGDRASDWLNSPGRRTNPLFGSPI